MPFGELCDWILIGVQGLPQYPTPSSPQVRATQTPLRSYSSKSPLNRQAIGGKFHQIPPICHSVNFLIGSLFVFEALWHLPKSYTPMPGSYRPQPDPIPTDAARCRPLPPKSAEIRPLCPGAAGVRRSALFATVRDTLRVEASGPIRG